MMVKQPDNIYDSNAIAVQTLSGQELGYVPKEHTNRFLHDITFGQVYSSGKNAKGLWGVTVSSDWAHVEISTHVLPDTFAHIGAGPIAMLALVSCSTPVTADGPACWSWCLAVLHHLPAQ